MEKYQGIHGEFSVNMGMTLHIQYMLDLIITKNRFRLGTCVDHINFKRAIKEVDEAPPVNSVVVRAIM